jgi:chemosensory pili system protein ChpA (sensor histidine kinase/response regulator)
MVSGAQKALRQTKTAQTEGKLMAAFNIGFARSIKPSAQEALDQAGRAASAAAEKALERGALAQEAQQGLKAAHGAFRMLSLDGFAQVSQEALDGAGALAASASPEPLARAVARACSELSARLDAALRAEKEEAGALMGALRALREAQGLAAPKISDLFFPALADVAQAPAAELQAPAEAKETAAAARSAVEGAWARWSERPAGQGMDAGDAAALSAELLGASRSMAAGSGAQFAPILGAAAAFFEELSQAPGGEGDADERAFAPALIAELAKWDESDAAPAAAAAPYRRIARAAAARHEARVGSQAAAALSAAGEATREALHAAGWAEHAKLALGAVSQGARGALSAQDVEEIGSQLALARDGLEALRASTAQSAGTAQVGQAASEFEAAAKKLSQMLGERSHKEAKKLADAAFFVGSKAAAQERRLRLTDAIVAETASLLVMLGSWTERRGLAGERFSSQVDTQISRLASALKNQPQELEGLKRPEVGDEESREQRRALQSRAYAEVRKDVKRAEEALDAFLREEFDRAQEAGEAREAAASLTRAIGALRLLGQHDAAGVMGRTRELALRMAAAGEAGEEPDAAQSRALAQALGALSLWVEAADRGDTTASRFLEPVERALAAAGEQERAKAEAPAAAPAPEAAPAAIEEADAIEFEPARPAIEWATDDAPAPAAHKPDWAKPEEPELAATFAEEAVDLAQTVREAAQAVQNGAHDALSRVDDARRALHTLKGSGRMVGLWILGDAAQAGENGARAWHDAGRADGEPLREALSRSAEIFGAWARQLRDDGGVDTSAAAEVHALWTRAQEALDGRAAPAHGHAAIEPIEIPEIEPLEIPSIEPIEADGHSAGDAPAFADDALEWSAPDLSAERASQGHEGAGSAHAEATADEASLTAALAHEAGERRQTALGALARWRAGEDCSAELAEEAAAIAPLLTGMGDAQGAKRAEALEAFALAGLSSWKKPTEREWTLAESAARGEGDAEALEDAAARLREGGEAAIEAERQDAKRAAGAFGAAIAAAKRAPLDASASASLRLAAQEAAEIGRRMARLEEIFRGLAEACERAEAGGEAEKKKPLSGETSSRG